MTNKKFRNYVARKLREYGIDWATSHKVARAYNSRGDRAAANVLAKCMGVVFLLEDGTYGEWTCFYGLPEYRNESYLVINEERFVFCFEQGNFLTTLKLNKQ